VILVVCEQYEKGAWETWRLLADERKSEISEKIGKYLEKYQHSQQLVHSPGAIKLNLETTLDTLFVRQLRQLTLICCCGQQTEKSTASDKEFACTKTCSISVGRLFLQAFLLTKKHILMLDADCHWVFPAPLLSSPGRLQVGDLVICAMTKEDWAAGPTLCGLQVQVNVRRDETP